MYREVLADIVHGRLVPGHYVKLLPLAQLYGTSTATLREALIHLSSERLMMREPMLGFRIAPATQIDLLELVKTLAWLESIGIRESVSHADPHWRNDVLAAHRALSLCSISDAANAHGLSEWEERLLAYHEALMNGCQSSILIAQCRELNQRLLRYRNLAARAVPHSRCDYDHLLEIRDAALQEDAERAITLLESYFKATADVVLSSLVLN